MNLCCRVDGDEVTKLTPYFNGTRWPKLYRWAREYLSTEAGRHALHVAIEREQENIRNDYQEDW